ncbi:MULTISPECIES: response regulator [Ramlibacter]|uniref:Response regulator n=1 Tax=Ramlibacter aquaticus TaxID=2780094 RepID=A0ABR9SG77_9BURK|nr:MULTISPECIES: response regulator [Ramlibacter]MBE7941351.1 response regulator [Ramlibacter aquaticus]
MSAAARQGLVFVVDDVEANRVLAQAYLRRIGWQVRCFPDAHSLLAALDDEVPQAMLIDVRMPELAGDELAALLRRRPATARLRLVGYTAHALKDELAGFLAAGFDEVLIKPVLMADMQRALPLQPATS